ncbi:MAG: retropepsin-like aspartic protease, partial [Candidatus Solibacter sp.]|nr:retropepsin-like aspartic protease [Candidatus Solibacter sp.]
ASMSVMTEAEAKRLGMRMVEGQPQFFGPSGENSSSGRYAVAERLSIGNTEMRNAAFLVLPDGLEVFEAIPLGQQGAVGLPVMMALETIRWNRGHELSTGFPAGRADVRTANLSFEENDPLTTMEVDGRRLTLDIDTGCRRSDLWPKFAEEFPAIIRTARQGTEHFVGATGGTTMDAAFLPELRMKVAGFPIVFPDVPVLKAVTVPASKWHYGWLCMDILAKAAEVTLDFRAMRIQLK